MYIIVLSVLNSVFLVCGQILWKYGLEGKEFDSIQNTIKILFSPLILAGIVVYGLTTILWLYILTKADISYVYPLTSIVHILMFFCALFIFKEQIFYTRWIGVTLITAGVVFISLK